MKVSIMEQIKYYSHNLDNVSFKAIADFILKHTSNLSSFTIFKVAKDTNTSPSSVTRFCKKIGLTGYKSLSAMIEVENKYKDVNVIRTIKNDVKEKYFISTSDIVLRSVLKVNNNAQDSIHKASNLIKKAKKIYIFGKGGNRYLIKMFVGWMMRIDYDVIFSGDTDNQRSYSHKVDDKDIMLVISYSLSSSFIKYIMENRAEGVKTIFLTNNRYSNLILDYDPVILMGHNESIIEDSYSSEISTIFILKLLFHSLLDEKIIRLQYKTSEL